MRILEPFEFCRLSSALCELGSTLLLRCVLCAYFAIFKDCLDYFDGKKGETSIDTANQCG